MGWWGGGVVEWWSGGVVEWWSGGGWEAALSVTKARCAENPTFVFFVIFCELFFLRKSAPVAP
jgi:hypothetical protein